MPQFGGFRNSIFLADICAQNIDNAGRAPYCQRNILTVQAVIQFDV